MKLRIGIFDSGIGGFTILNSLLKTRSDLEVFYLADTKRVPYGNKNSLLIRSIAIEICNWFKDKNLDAILIACNTTNSCALDVIEEYFKIPCFDLINSVSEKITKKHVGVLATPTTVKSLFYKKTIESKIKNVKVFQQECPELVSEIEKIPLDLKKIDYLAHLYLNELLKQNIEELILGCSHYPLICNAIKNKMHSKIKIIDPSVALVQNFNNYFPNTWNDCSDCISYDSVSFCVTANSEDFSTKVKNWFEINKEIRLVNLRSND